MQSFRRLTISTLVAVYVLILVGGIVRSSGSGMGCPDWPKCFGSWVPPTSVEQLPADYQEFYSAYREKKNVKFAKYLTALGFDETAQKLLNDKTVLEEAAFNPTKTWIEYVNRLVGVVIGFMIFAVFVSSLKFRKSKRSLTVMAFLLFIMVGFQGWLGSIVVSTNLTAWTITLHMFLALVIVAMLAYLLVVSSEQPYVGTQKKISGWLVMVCLIVLTVQILWGTKVREAIDLAAASLPRDSWISNLGKPFLIHRSFSWVVLLFYVGLSYNLIKTLGLKPFPLTLIVLILGAILSGAGMAYFAVPAFLQPVHLLLASLAFGVQFILLLELTRKSPEIKTV
jgi:cytochrome c oxidase assembly protein subunit 15